MIHIKLLLLFSWLTLVGSQSLCQTTSPRLPTQHLTKFFYLHIPKAGTSFATCLYHYVCNISADAKPSTHHESAHPVSLPMFEKSFGKFKNQCNLTQWLGRRWGHIPVSPRADASRMLVMIRDPRRRILSAYHYGLHVFGMSDEARATMTNSVKSVTDFIRFPGVAGCMTNLLTGHTCASVVTPGRAEQAIQVLRQAAFIGITDDWDASICLFHAMFGGQPVPVEFHNVRPTATLTARGQPYQHSAHKAISIEEDPADWQVYQAALDIFRTRQRAYGKPEYVAPESESVIQR
eukprot:m.9085 g.9085  ORF g.9085 m.9085 type:complete len:292 (-) comp9355_c0_seq4:73-948(-)